MEKLYQEYGRLMVQLEILNNQIAQVKTAIAQELNKPPKLEEVKKDG